MDFWRQNNMRKINIQYLLDVENAHHICLLASFFQSSNYRFHIECTDVNKKLFCLFLISQIKRPWTELLLQKSKLEIAKIEVGHALSSIMGYQLLTVVNDAVFSHNLGPFRNKLSWILDSLVSLSTLQGVALIFSGAKFDVCHLKLASVRRSFSNLSI